MREIQLKAFKAIMIFAYIVQDDHKLDVVFKWACDEFGIESLDESEWSADQCDKIIKICTAERALDWQPNKINTDAVKAKTNWVPMVIFTFIMFLSFLAIINIFN